MLSASLELVDGALPRCVQLAAVRRDAHLDEVVPVALRKAYRLIEQRPAADARKLPVYCGLQAQADLAKYFERCKEAGSEQIFDTLSIVGDYKDAEILGLIGTNCQ